MINIKTEAHKALGKSTLVKELTCDNKEELICIQQIDTSQKTFTQFHEDLISLLNLGEVTYTLSGSQYRNDTGERASLTFEQIEGTEDCFYLSTSSIEDSVYNETKLPIRVIEGLELFNLGFFTLSWG